MSVGRTRTGREWQARAAVKRSLSLFEEAVSQSDSSKGDDVTEVLKDWAQVRVSLGTM